MARIRLEKATVKRGERKTLVDADLEVEAGELVVLVGASGSGKSTLLKTINRLVPLSSGAVFLEGKNVVEMGDEVLRRKVGYCFQALGLFPHMTVAENIGIGLRLAGQDDVDARVRELCALVSLPHQTFASRFPSELSGGQAQRVAVARALATKPPVLLLDEPFGALDPETRAQIQGELLAVCEKEGPSILLVSHDMGEALKVADRIAVLADGQLLRVAEPRALLRDPGDPRIEALIAPARENARAIVALSSEGA